VSQENLPHIVGVCGSLRDGSHTLQALKHALAAAEEAGARVTLFHPGETLLPFCYGPEEGELAANAKKWRALAREADGFILATPEYHGSCSGVLKNALDLVGFDEMEDKVCGLISVLGGGANSSALNNLRLICRHVHAWVIPHQAAIGAAYGAFDESGAFKDAKLAARVARVGTDVARYARSLRAERLSG